MSTGGSFTPPVVPECAYAPRMTRAQAVALMFAGGLNPNCVVVITDGPVIGTPGNTSPTEIEMQPVSATDIGRTALVHTTFSAQAWGGTYDLNTGTIFNLLDDWNNFAEDEDPGAPTVHTQVPWHKGSALFSGNRFDTCTLPGWDVAGGNITDNTLKGSTVNLTGMTNAGNVFKRNSCTQATFTVATAAPVLIQANTIVDGSVQFLGSGPIGFQSNAVTANGAVFVDAASTALIAMGRNEISADYRVFVEGATNTNPGIGCNANRMSDRGPGTSELRYRGPASMEVNDNTISAGNIRLDGTGLTRIDSNTMNNVLITRAVGSAAPLRVLGNQYSNSVLTIGPANAGTDNNLTNNVIRGGTFTWNGPVAGTGLNAMVNATMLSLNLTTAATATAGIAITAGVFTRGSIVQNRTAGGGSLYLRDCTMIGENSNVTDNGTVDTGNALEMHAVNLTESVVTFGDVVARNISPPALFGIDMMSSTLNVTGLGSPPDSQIRNGRLQNATITNAGFALNIFEVTGVTRTLAANQSNKLVNVSYDNLV